jgi:hypothetical protein
MNGVPGIQHIKILLLVFAATVVSCDTSKNPNPNDGNTVEATIRFNKRFRNFRAGSLDVNVLRNASQESDRLRVHARRPASGLSSPVIDAVTTEVRRYFTQYKEQLQIDPNEVVVRKISRFDIDESLPGSVEIARFYRGIPVISVSMTLFFDQRTGKIQKISPSQGWHPVSDVLPVATIDSSQAAHIARVYIDKPDILVQKARLVYHKSMNNWEWEIAWYLNLLEPLPVYMSWSVVIDASTGIVQNAVRDISHKRSLDPDIFSCERGPRYIYAPNARIIYPNKAMNGGYEPSHMFDGFEQVNEALFPIARLMRLTQQDDNAFYPSVPSLVNKWLFRGEWAFSFGNDPNITHVDLSDYLPSPQSSWEDARAVASDEGFPARITLPTEPLCPFWCEDVPSSSRFL